ncbi:hypothetical protein KGA66_27755, partial [Actinocrinis puniceicyclus]
GLGWGLWAQRSSMTERLGRADEARIARGGFQPMPSDEALALFDAALFTGRAAVLPARLDLPALRGQAASGTLPPLFADLVLVADTTARSGSHGPAGADLVGQLADASPTQRAALMLTLVRTQAATVLGHNGPERIETTRGFLDQGVDSLTALELRNRLNAATGLSLPTTVVLDHPTPQALADRLAQELSGDSADSATPGASVLADFEHFETAATAEGVDEETRRQISERLRALLARLGAGRLEPVAAGSAPDLTYAFADPIESATDDEIFDLIDREFDI